MYSRWFNVTVVILWLATMSWLVKAKVLPLLEIGEPPNFSEIVESQVDDPPVGWEILADNKRLGWAMTETKAQGSGVREIHGRVHVDKFPLGKILPGWIKPILQLAGISLDEVRIDVRSVLSIDCVGNLPGFESTMRLNPPDEVIHLSGNVEGGKLMLKVRATGISVSKEYALPPKALPSDLFSPQTKLSDHLYEGRTWSAPVYSPLLPDKDPLKYVHVTVEGLEPISWNGVTENVWLVVYRSDSGSGSDGNRNVLGKAWVRRDGMILRQQARFSNSTITFVRMTQRQAVKLADSLGKQWWTPEQGAWTKSHD